MQAVLEAANIVDVISGYTSLRKRGITYSGLCPFHQEKTPSFTVSADKGLYYCFGCGEGGDRGAFPRKGMENLTFSEVIEHLGERYGVSVEYEEGAGPDTGRKDRDTRLCNCSTRRPCSISAFCGNHKAEAPPVSTWRSGVWAARSARPVPGRPVAGRVEGAAAESGEGRVLRPRAGGRRSAGASGGQDLRPLPRPADVPVGGPSGPGGGVWGTDAQGREPEVSQLAGGASVSERPSSLRALSRPDGPSQRQTRWWW